MVLQVSPLEFLARCTTRLECEMADGERSVGTAFRFDLPLREGSVLPLLVTNRHVVAGAIAMNLRITTCDASGAATGFSDHRKAVGDDTWRFHPDGLDLCAWQLTPLVQREMRLGNHLLMAALTPSIILKDDDEAVVGIGCPIRMVGYPNGLWDDIANEPVVRAGIAASNPRTSWRGKPEFLIDCSCFPGSSGSPVFEYEAFSHATKSGWNIGQGRLTFLGVLYGGPVFNAEGKFTIEPVPTSTATVQVPMNLGLVIRAAEVIRLAEFVRDCGAARG